MTSRAGVGTRERVEVACVRLALLLQLAEEQQTAQLPRDAAERTALARRIGYAEPAGADALRRFEADLARTRSLVREQFEALVLGSRAR